MNLKSVRRWLRPSVRRAVQPVLRGDWALARKPSVFTEMGNGDCRKPWGRGSKHWAHVLRGCQEGWSLAGRCFPIPGVWSGQSWRNLIKNSLQRLNRKRKALSIVKQRRPPMRSTTRHRLAQCASCTEAAIAQRLVDAFTDWCASRCRYVDAVMAPSPQRCAGRSGWSPGLSRPTSRQPLPSRPSLLRRLVALVAAVCARLQRPLRRGR